MYSIADISTEEIQCSPYIQPLAVHYTQNGERKRWDTIKSHDSVSILVHNVTRDVFILVKQFRPAVYMCLARSNGENGSTVDHKKVPPSRAFTLELCAGILDKNKSIEEIAVEEVLEECGYSITVSQLEKIVRCRSSVGISGSEQTMFYARVTDDMRVGKGGGNLQEGEMIEIAEIPVKSCLEVVMDESLEKPIGMLFAMMWFLKNKI